MLVQALPTTTLPLPRPTAPQALAFPVPADEYHGTPQPHTWVKDADAPTYRRVCAAEGAAIGAFAGGPAVLGAGVALGVAAAGALGAPGLLGLAAGVAGAAVGGYLGVMVHTKLHLGKQLGARVGAALGDLAGRAAAALNLPLRSDHIDETRDFSPSKMISHLNDSSYTHHPRISETEAEGFMAQLKPGDIVLTNDESATLWTVLVGMVDGKADFSHALLYQGDGKTLESRTVTHGVAEGDLKSVLMRKHHAVAVRPRYTSDAQALDVVQKGRDKIGTPYDFRFRFGDDSLYCSEFVYKSVTEAAPQVAFEQRAVIGRVAVLPGDLLHTRQADVVAEVGKDSTAFNGYMSKFV